MGKYLKGNLPESGKRLFLETFEFHGSADIRLGGTFQIYNYINGYKLSADALVDAGLNGQPYDLERYVYSIIYNYKQFLELSMKAIYLFYSDDTVEIKTQNIARVSHNLEKTWELIEPLLNHIYTTPDEVSVMHAAKEYVLEFHNLDNDSYNFRYPFTKALITKLDLSYKIDVVNLKERMEELYQFLRLSDFLLEDNLNFTLAENQKFKEGQFLNVFKDIEK